MAKRTYRKGMELINKSTREKILFGKWNDDGSATCFAVKTKLFLTLSPTNLETDYISPSQIEKAAREQRRGQCW